MSATPTIKRIYEPAGEEDADRYRAELKANPALDCLLDISREAESVTLLYAARDPDCNHAVVLRDFTRDALAG